MQIRQSGLRSAFVVAAAGLVLLVPAGARGQAVLDGDWMSVGANGVVYAPPQMNEPPDGVYSAFDLVHWFGNSLSLVKKNGGQSESLFVTLPQDDQGVTGLMESAWNHQYLGGSPGLGGVFRGVSVQGVVSSASANESDGLNVYLGSVTGSNVYFTVTEETPWTWEASLSGETDGFGWLFYHFNLVEVTGWHSFMDGEPFPVTGERHASGWVHDKSVDDVISLSGVLQPGTYWFQAGIAAKVSMYGDPMLEWTEGSGWASLTMDGVFTLGGPVPAPGAGVALGLGLLAARRRRLGQADGRAGTERRPA